MRDYGLDKVPAESRNHTDVIAAVDRRDLPSDCEQDKKDDGHSEGRDCAEKHGKGHQNFVEAFTDVSGKRAKEVAQEPADNDGRKLEGKGPWDGVADNI